MAFAKNKSCSSRFWEREEIAALTSQEQLAYLKVLTTSSFYDIHGLTILEPLAKTIKKRSKEHKIPIEQIKLLAKKGLLIFDEFNSIVFVPGSTSDLEAHIENFGDLRKIQNILKRFPATSRPAQIWALSWFLTNLTTIKIAVLEDFLEHVQPYIKLIIQDTASNGDLNQTNLSDLVLLDPINRFVSIEDVMSLVVQEQKCYPGVADTLVKDIIGDKFDKKLELYLKRRDIYHDSLIYNLIEQFRSLYSEKKGISYSEYESKTFDPRRMAWMVREYGVELVKERMRLYFDSNEFLHSINDFKTNFQKIGKPDTSDLSNYFNIIGEFEKRARGNN